MLIPPYAQMGTSLWIQAGLIGDAMIGLSTIACLNGGRERIAPVVTAIGVFLGWASAPCPTTTTTTPTPNAG